MRKPIRILVNAGLILASTVVALLAAELALRFWYFGALQAPEFGAEILLRKPHPELGWTLLPNASALAQTLDYTVRVDINSHGLRDREHAYEPEPGVFRVLVLGDSFMEAQQVRLEDCLARQLEKKLAGRRVEVINLGVTAYGTAQEYLLLKSEGLKYKPDLVVLAFFAHNDLTNNAFKLERILRGRDDIRVAGRPFLLPGDGPELAFTTPDYEKALAQYEKSLRIYAARDNRRALHERTVIGQLYTLARRAYGDTGHNVPEHDPNVHFGPYLDVYDATLSSNNQMTNAWYVDRWTEAWDYTERLLAATKQLCENNDAPFVVFCIPSVVELSEEFQAQVKEKYPQLQLVYDKPARKVTEIGDRHGFPVLDLAPPFKAADTDSAMSYYHTRSDKHWNAAGHGLAADALITFLDERGLLPDSDATP